VPNLPKKRAPKKAKSEPRRSPPALGSSRDPSEERTLKIIVGTPVSPPRWAHLIEDLEPPPFGETYMDEDAGRNQAFLDAIRDGIDDVQAIEDAERDLRSIQDDEERDDRTVVVGLPTITRLLMGFDVHFLNLGVTLIPDSVIHNGRHDIRGVVAYTPSED
jgi:hypothetical protein